MKKITDEEFEKLKKKYENIRKEYIISKEEYLALNRKQEKIWADKMDNEMNESEYNYWCKELMNIDPNLLRATNFEDNQEEFLDAYYNIK